MFLRSFLYRFPAPQRPMVCAIDATGLFLQGQLLLQTQLASLSVRLYLFSTVLVFFASLLYHYAPSLSGFTIRFDMTALYLLIIFTALPYWNGDLAFWWLDVEWPTGNYIAISLACLTLWYLWRPSYTPHKGQNVAILLGLSFVPTLHIFTGRHLLDVEVTTLWFSGLVLFVAALIIYARKSRWSQLALSHYAYYHLLLLPAVYLHSLAALASDHTHTFK